MNQINKTWIKYSRKLWVKSSQTWWVKSSQTQWVKSSETLFPLGRHTYPVSITQSTIFIYFCLWISNIWGEFISPCTSFSSMIFENDRVLFAKTNLSSKNHGIFHNLNVGLLQRHTGKCGTTWTWLNRT